MVRRDWKPREGSSSGDSRGRSGSTSGEGSTSPERAFAPSDERVGGGGERDAPPHQVVASSSRAADAAVEDLAASFATTSISMVPRSVRLGKARTKAGGAPGVVVGLGRAGGSGVGEDDGMS